jgi:hypothetical protein
MTLNEMLLLNVTKKWPSRGNLSTEYLMKIHRESPRIVRFLGHSCRSLGCNARLDGSHRQAGPFGFCTQGVPLSTDQDQFPPGDSGTL